MISRRPRTASAARYCLHNVVAYSGGENDHADMVLQHLELGEDASEHGEGRDGAVARGEEVNRRARTSQTAPQLD